MHITNNIVGLNFSFKENEVEKLFKFTIAYNFGFDYHTICCTLYKRRFVLYEINFHY